MTSGAGIIRGDSVLFLLPLLLAATSPLPRDATPATVLAPDAEQRWVPFELTPGNQIRFTMTLNGKPASAILDTGVSTTAASRPFAAHAGLKPTVSGVADAIGGRVRLGWATSGTLSIGGMARRGGRIAVTELDTIATGGQQPIDVLVGADLLACCALDIDFDAGRFRLIPSGRMPFRGQVAPLSLEANSGIYMSEAAVGMHRLRPIIVDTGDGSAFTLSRTASAGVMPPRMTTGIAYGLGGAIETGMGILSALRIGRTTAQDVELRVERDGGFSDRKGAAGRIGAALLQRYRVLLDPGAGRMILLPGARATQAAARSTSGLLLGQEGDRLRVLHVMRGGPAEADGWRNGDSICQVDGVAIRRGAETGWSAGTPGRTVRLTLCDGPERPLMLRNFY